MLGPKKELKKRSVPKAVSLRKHRKSVLGQLSAGDYHVQPYSKDRLGQDQKTHSKIHILVSLSPEKNREQVNFGAVFFSFSVCSAVLSLHIAF